MSKKLKKLQIIYITGLLSVSVAAHAVPTINIDAPGNDETVTGTIQIYGWASGEPPMEQVTLQVDNDNPVTIGYGGQRTDVGLQRPNDYDANYSGFSTALNTHLLSNGAHKITLEAENVTGEKTVTSLNLTVYNPPGNESNNRDQVHLHNTTMSLHEGHMVLDNVMINGQTHNSIHLEFNPVTNSFQIVGIGATHTTDNDQTDGGPSASDPVVLGKAAYAEYGCADASCHNVDPVANQNNILKGSGHGAIMGALATVPEMADVAKRLGEDHRTMIDIADYIKSVKPVRTP